MPNLENDRIGLHPSGMITSVHTSYCCSCFRRRIKPWMFQVVLGFKLWNSQEGFLFMFKFNLFLFMFIFNLKVNSKKIITENPLKIIIPLVETRWKYMKQNTIRFNQRLIIQRALNLTSPESSSRISYYFLSANVTILDEDRES